jgi:hypothetical protein
MKEKINKSEKEDIFDELRRSIDELRRSMKSSPFLAKVLEKFNIFSLSERLRVDSFNSCSCIILTS